VDEKERRRKDDLDWLADKIHEYKKPYKIFRLVIGGAFILVSASFFIAKLAWIIIERGLLDGF